MANKNKSMLQIRRIIQLMQNGISKRDISRQLSISRNTVDQYANKCLESEKTHQELLDLADEELALIVHNNLAFKQKDSRFDYLQKQFSYYKQELTRTGVTRLLLWEEYIKQQPEGYSYSQFCEHYSQYSLRSKVVMHFDHQPAEVLQVDFAGDKLSFIDSETAVITVCPVLVCVLPFSSYMYVEALLSCQQEELIVALNRCMSYLGGVPHNLKSDNMKQWVIKPNRYEPTYNELMEQFSLHYNTGISAARPRKPRDKATVEKSVDLTYKRIFAPLRNKLFFNLQELNEAVFEQLHIHNNTPMQNRDYSRYERFIQEESIYLRALPPESFVLKHKVMAKVQRNYHIILGEDWHQYSVPHQYTGKKVSLVYDHVHVEIYLDLKRIAFHYRDYRRNEYTTLKEHMPPEHQHYHKTRGWNEDYFLAEAEKIGPNTVSAFQQILQSRMFTEQTYNSCLGILRLAKKYSFPRMEAAIALASQFGRVTYKRLDNILSHNRDKEDTAVPVQFTIPFHDNIRGSEAYN